MLPPKNGEIGHTEKILKKQKPGISKQQLKSALESLRRANPFQNIENPVKWQREQRKDRDLFGLVIKGQ